MCSLALDSFKTQTPSRVIWHNLTAPWTWHDKSLFSRYVVAKSAWSYFLQSVVLLIVLCHAEVFANKSHMHDLLTTFKQFHTVFLDAPGHCIPLLQRHPKQILFDTASRPQSFLITRCIRAVPNLPSRKTTVATRHGYGRNGRCLAGNVPVSLGRLPGVLVMHNWRCWSFDAFFNYLNADMTRTHKGHQVSG